jgi:hypothetical protein
MGQILEGQFSDIDKIIISKTGWYTTTDVSITCANFENYNFPCYISTSPKVIRKFCKIISKLEANNSNVYPDYRCKIYMFRKDTLINSICVDRANVLIDGFNFKTSKRLITELDKIKDRVYNFNSNNYFIEDYPGGQDAIYSFVEKELEKSKISLSDLNLIIIVSIDREGNTINLQFKNKNNDSVIPESLKSTLDDIFYNRIKWNKNSQRPSIYRIALRIGRR